MGTDHTFLQKKLIKYLKNFCWSVPKKLLRGRKRKTIQAIAKLFTLHANAKKLFQSSLFIDILLKITNKQFIVIDKIAVSLEP